MLNRTLEQAINKVYTKLQQAEEWKKQTYEDTPARVEAVFRVRMWQDAFAAVIGCKIGDDDYLWNLHECKMGRK